MKTTQKILVVDDEPKIIEVVSSYLKNAGYTVIEAFNGIQALELFAQHSPSLVILDLMLPDLMGEEICRRLRNCSRVPVIMLTAKVEEEDILGGLGGGADDYVTKPFSPRQLVARVEAILRRTAAEVGPLTSQFNYNQGELVIHPAKREVYKDGVSVSLTPIEYGLLITMVSHPRKAFTREELIRLSLGDDYEGFDRNIDSHIKNLRQKIEPNPKNPRYILTVHGVGYKFGGD